MSAPDWPIKVATGYTPNMRRVYHVHDWGIGRPILRLAWGPRRVTRSRRYDTTGVSAYPNCVGGTAGLWREWIISGIGKWLRWEWQIVIPDTKAEARIRAAVQDLDQPAPPPAPDQGEVDALIAERAQLRAAKRFAEADAIRDRLTAMGIEVKDAKA